MKRISWNDFLKNADPALKRLNEETMFILWGCSQTGWNVLYLLSQKYKNIKVWENQYAGKNVEVGNAGRYVIEPLAFESIPESEKGNAIIIDASENAQYAAKFFDILKQNGFKHCYRAADFFESYPTSKVHADYELYNQLNQDRNFVISPENAWLITDDWYANAGVPMNDDYFVQDLWGAQKVFEARPERHYDIGSSVGGFIAHLLAFKMPTVLIDIRPLQTYGTEYVTFIQEDATLLKGMSDDSIESLSALCSFEHFGLGRYGDPVDPDAHVKAFGSACRVLKKGGNFYLSLPVAPQCRLEFNAHRVYAPGYVIERFTGMGMELIEFSLCSNTGLVKNAPLDTSSGTGLFHFRK